MNQKMLMSILAIAILFLGGTVVYFLTAQKNVAPVVQTPTPISKTLPAPEKTNPVAQDETAGWKTYTDSSYGYSFQYPQKLIINEETTNSITLGSRAVPYLNVSVQKLVGEVTAFAQNQILTEGNGIYKKEDITCVQKTILNRASVECSYENQIGGYVGKRIETFILGENGFVFRIIAISGYIGMAQSEFQNKVVNSFSLIIKAMK